MNKMQIVDKVIDYYNKNIMNDLSFTKMLKVEGFLHNLKEEIRLEGLKNDRTRKTNRG